MTDQTIDELLEQEAQKDYLVFSTAGSVDDGKSTLIGRLLHDSKNVYEDHLAAIKKTKGSVENQIDWALLTDGLKAEREQGITIDVAYRYFSTPKRKFIIADTPGHEQYTRNMATGASNANLAIVLVDASKGVLPQSKRHAFIASLLRIPHMIVAVNKMDLVGYEEAVFEEVKEAFSTFSARLGIPDLRYVPISALEGDNVVTTSENMPWYKGEPLMQMLETLQTSGDRNLVDFRFPVQYVNRPHADFRGYCGKVASGVVRKGDEIVVLPSFQRSRVAAIETFDGELDRAFPPLSVTLTLEDELDISRGDIIAGPHNVPHFERQFEAMLVWMDEEDLDPEVNYFIKCGTQTSRVGISKINYRIDVNTLSQEKTDTLRVNEIGRVAFSAHRPLLFDLYEKNRELGSFILIDPVNNRTVGAGTIIEREPSRNLPSKVGTKPVAWPSKRQHMGKISFEERCEIYRQKPVALWITGLVSAGKTELAFEVERRLLAAGHMAMAFNGSSTRSGLSRDLDFTSTGTAEHLRRVAEMVRLANEQGLICLCAFVSPLSLEREQVRKIIGEDRFLEVHLDVPIAYCEGRDDSGFYEKARAGEIQCFPGVNYPFEPPEQPDLVLQPHQMEREEMVEKIMNLMWPHIRY